ncbi:kirola-like [Cucumis melo var. makuwa]|uniref:Kirola-like n=1 Tax=Cucumis melo var. makuwa TaxID=1194695 RepID=A0A5A7UFY0_CUCMM|nr:kirola-like [Cucumis melo var. makuwa]TYK01542.1 kirola-like [Cucumis melo var. makuwa]
MFQLAQMFPKNLHNGEFLEGNDFTTGALMQWSYDIVGPAKAKIKLADVDEQNMSITYEAVEGDILSDYNFFRVKFQASSNGENGSATVKWSIEFEKADENIPSAEANYLDFVSKLSMGLDFNQDATLHFAQAETASCDTYSRFTRTTTLRSTDDDPSLSLSNRSHTTARPSLLLKQYCHTTAIPTSGLFCTSTTATRTTALHCSADDDAIIVSVQSPLSLKLWHRLRLQGKAPKKLWLVKIFLKVKADSK